MQKDCHTFFSCLWQKSGFYRCHTEGITKITPADIQYAKAMGRTIKLLAFSKKEEEQVTAMVAPYLVDKEDPLASVNGVFNAIFVHGNMLGDAMFYGQGAGGGKRQQPAL